MASPPPVRLAVDWMLPPELRVQASAATRRARFFAATLLSALGAGLVVLVHRVSDADVSNLPRLGVYTGFAVIFAAMVVLRRRGDVDLAATILLGGTAVFIPLDAVGWGGIRASGLGALVCLPVVASFLLHERATALVALAVACALVVDSVLTARLGVQPPLVSMVGRVADVGVCLLLLLVMTLVALAHQRERRELQAQLEEREARYAAAIAADHAGIFEWRQGEGVAGVSPRLRQMFPEPGFPACLDPAARQAVERTVEALRTDERASLEVRLSRDDRGTEWFRLDFLGTQSAHGRAVVGIVRDITEQHRTARLKDEFVSVVSHELRTPLTAIHGAVTLLGHGAVRPGSERPEVAHLLQIAARNSTRLLGLVDDLLDVQRLHGGALTVELRPQSVLVSVQATVQAIAPVAAERGLRIRTEGGDDTPVHADPRRLEQVLTNLVGNACKWAPPGSEVVVAVEGVPDGVKISVTDAGPGVPESFRDHLFERFSQADTGPERGRGGTGLGLYISRSLTQRMGGQIGYTPASPVGSTFWVVLPVAPDRLS